MNIGHLFFSLSLSYQFLPKSKSRSQLHHSDYVNILSYKRLQHYLRIDHYLDKLKEENIGSISECSFIYLFTAVLGLCCCPGVFLVAVSGACSLVEVHGLLVVAAFSVAEHRLQGAEALVVVACGTFLDQGSNTCPLHWQADS